MVGVTLCPETPEDVVAFTLEIDGFVTFGAMTETTSADRFAATVVVRDQVILAVRRVVAGAHPGNRRRFRTRWTGRHAATAA